MSTTRLFTIDDLLGTELPEFWELIEGELFELSPSTPKSGALSLRLGAAVLQFVESHGLGEVVGAEGGFRLEADPDSLVAPDVAYVSGDRLPLPESGFPQLVPDFVIEVLSPSDRPSHVRAKQALYDRAGVSLLWYVDPAKETVTVVQPGRETIVVGRDGVLDGGEVLPGFELPVAEIFRTQGKGL